MIEIRRNSQLLDVVLLCMALLLSSCINDVSGPGDGTAHLSLTLDVGKTTRALSDAESTVNDITVLVFDGSNNLIGSNYSTFTATTAAPYAMNVTARTGTNCTIYAIANTGSSTYFSSVKTLSDFQSMKVTSDPNSGSSLMMFGKLTGVTIGATGVTSSSNTSSANSISLSRLCSKFNFTITPTNGITITGYQLVNIPGSSYIYDGSSTSNPSGTNLTFNAVSGLTSTTAVPFSYYMYENLAGTNINSKDEASRNSGNLPTGTTASYLEVNAQKTGSWHSTYRIYLGGINASGATDYTDYNVRRNCNYTCNVAINGPGQSDARVSYTSDVPPVSPVSNCYIMSPGSTISIPITRVNDFWNSSDAKTSNANAANYVINSTDTWQASIIWQEASGLVTVTTSTGTGPNSTIGLQVPSNASAGNALIGIKKTSGTGTEAYLWSWNIWVTTYNPSVTNVIYNGYTWMDRNLGAAANTGTNSYGLYYQWGRKDPFLGTNTTCVTHDPGSSGNNLSLSVENPMIFYLAGNPPKAGGCLDWYTSKGSHNYVLWGSSKTIYDPCPVGWIIPDNSHWGSTANLSDFAGSTYGRTYKSYIFFPCAGMLGFNSGIIGNEAPNNASVGYFWSSSFFDANDMGILTFSNSSGGYIYTSSFAGTSLSAGCSVRCVQDK